MKTNVLIFGATGLMGRHIVAECTRKGYNITVYIRQAHYTLDGVKVIQGELGDEAAILAAMEGQDVIVSAVGNRDYADATMVVAPLAKLLARHTKPQQRLIQIGGSGLTLHDANTLRRDLPGQPEFLKNQRTDHWEAYSHVAPLDINYLFVCPTMVVDGEPDGAYLEAEVYFPTSVQKQVSAGNVAQFVAEEISHQRYSKTRVGLANR